MNIKPDASDAELAAGNPVCSSALFYRRMDMNIQRTIKPSFTVIGKEGSTQDGDGFIQKLWEDANSHFPEIAHLAKKNANGELAGIWGAMSDFSRSFQPWEYGFRQGLYLAGCECSDDAEAPEGWVKWVIPAYEYLYTERINDRTFRQVMAYLFQNQITLAGAVHDYTDPKSGKNYIFVPIRKL